MNVNPSALNAHFIPKNIENLAPLRGANLISQDRDPFSIALCRVSLFRKSLSEAFQKVDRGARRATLRLIRGQSYLSG